MTSREFLDWAMRQPEGQRYELCGGEVVAMSPERASHNRVKFRAAVALENALVAAGLPCQVFTDGMAVEVDDETTYEPDAMVRCGEPVTDDTVVLNDPVIVVEVVPPSSGGVDSGVKLTGYFRLDSVRHYLIAHPRRRTVVHHWRDDSGRIATRIVGSGDLELEPPGVTIAVADLFA